MSDDLVLRPLAPDEVAAFHDALELAFHESAQPAVRARRTELLELDRTVIAFEGGQLVGTSGAHTQRMSIPGGELRCAGITVVTVRPTHRRRGILRRMMCALLADARRRGEPLAALWASEGGIYGRFGYGVAGWEAHVEIAGGGGAPRPPRDDGLRVELRAPAGAGELLAPLWERLRSQRPGVPDRSPLWWESRVLADLPEERGGATEKRLALARDVEDGTVRGYALYRIRPGAGERAALAVLELIAPEPEADAALWRYLCGVDLVGRIDAPRRPVDDPLPLRFDDVRRARVTGVGEALWLRLLDVPAALEGRAWSADLDLTLALTDEQLPENVGSWRLEATAGPEGAPPCCSRTDGSPDIALDVRELGAAYLGGTPLTRLADAGLVDERTPGAVARLDAALRAPRAPWTPEIF